MKTASILLAAALLPALLLAAGVPRGQMPNYTAMGSVLGQMGVIPGWDGSDRSYFDPYLPAIHDLFAALAPDLRPAENAALPAAGYDAEEKRLRGVYERAFASLDARDLWRRAEEKAAASSQAQAAEHLALFERLLAAYAGAQDEATRGPLLAEVAEMDEFARYRFLYLRGPVTVESLYARILEGLSPHQGHSDVLDRLRSLPSDGIGAMMDRMRRGAAPGGEVSPPVSRAPSPPRLTDERETIRRLTLQFAREHGAQHLLVLGSGDILSVRPDGSVEPYSGPELGLVERMRALRMTELFLREFDSFQRPPQVVDLNGDRITLDPRNAGPMIMRELRIHQPAPGESNWDFLRRLLGPQPSLARRVLFYAVAVLIISGAVALGLLLLRP